MSGSKHGLENGGCWETKIRTYFICTIRWVLLANGRVNPCGVAGFDSEHGGARCGIGLVRMSMLKIVNRRIPYPVAEMMH